MDINIDAKENIEYQSSYVAFIDVLGFKGLVFSQKKEDKERLKQYFGIVNEAIRYLKQIPSKSNIGSIIISDSIILSVPQAPVKEENINRLRHLCIAVGIIQLHLSLKNIWVRGAISSGEAYFNPQNNQVVGPAYINSYLLEKELAKNPRVILDSKIINELGFRSAARFIRKINEEPNGLNFSNWGSSILFDWQFTTSKPINKDVPLFIDYLLPIVEKGGENFELLVNNLAKSIYSDTNIYDKFRWVVEYLKEVVHKVHIRARSSTDPVGSEAALQLRNL